MPPDQNEKSLYRVNLLDLLVVVAKHKRFVLRFVAITVALSAILLFLILPRWYRSVTTVMPPKQKMGMGLITSLARATAPLRNLGLGQGSEDLANLQTIVLSRRIMEAVVLKFDLRQVYGESILEKAVRELEGNVAVDLGKEEVSLEIAVYDTDPVRASEIANFFVTMLDSVYIDMNATEARGNRQFLEGRYLQNLRDLESAEDAFKTFQQRTGVYSVPDQIKAAVEIAATLESRIAIKEIQLGVLERTTSEDNPMRESAKLEVMELRRQLEGMKRGDSRGSSLVFPPFSKAPEIGIEYFRRYRDVELQGKLLELLLPLYEQAKIEEQRNTPSVLVLDRAVPAVKASKPKRLIIMVLMFFGSAFIAVVLTLIRESLSKNRATRTREEEEKVELVRQAFSIKNLLR